MGKSFRKLAEELEVSPDTIRKKRKNRGIYGEGMSDEDEQSIRDEVLANKRVKEKLDGMANTLKKKSKSFKPNVRRIDEKDSSSIKDMLQDCKEQYVQNEITIQKLQFELDQHDSYMVSNNNGTVSLLPQLASLEKFQKVNISLRTQIASLEASLGRITNDESDDPFE